MSAIVIIVLNIGNIDLEHKCTITIVTLKK